MGPNDESGELAFAFDEAQRLATDDRIELLGGKGAGLVSMAAAGIPVPQGFTLTTVACRRFLDRGWTPDLTEAVARGVHRLEQTTGKAFGSSAAPLLVSVRSGARVSMPGMMDTVLNVGMNDEAEAALGLLTDDPSFARDTHRRALLSYAEVVAGAGPDELAIADALDAPADMRAALGERGITVPTRPIAQLVAATRAVFESWRSERAVTYRDVEGIPHDIGTAATIQTMVFGNLGPDSGTGVAFTRDPATGAAGLMGDFLASAQGEDVVAGTHVTEPLAAMEAKWPAVWAELRRIADQLERAERDMVDIEFTVEAGRLWLLQSRRAKRSPIAAYRVAIDMAEDAHFPLTRAEAVERCAPYRESPPVAAAVRDDGAVVVATGLAASPGRASGVLCLDADEAVRLEADGVDVILARRQTSPADIHGMAAAKGLFTTLGGLVSHAAVVARSWGLPAVVGASSASVTSDELIAGDRRIAAGTVVTVDGDAGELLLGGATGPGTPAPEVLTIERWAQAEDPVRVDGADPADEGDAETTFAVAHALRIKGFAGADAVAEMTGLDLDTARASLDALVAVGEARHHEARDMWQITPVGRDSHVDRLAKVVDALDLTALPYADFLAHNADFKALCSAWQVRNGEPNDHTDDGYDTAIRGRLDDFHVAAAPIISAVGATLPWTGAYPGRLRAALDRFASGDDSAFTGVLCNSYHDVWMELHEDLILTLGIDRAEEGST